MSKLMRRRERNIAELIEWAQDSKLDADLNINPSDVSERIFEEAKLRFLVTDGTASDYVRLVTRLLSDPLRACLIVQRYSNVSQ
jgi:hypothetical protein